MKKRILSIATGLLVFLGACDFSDFGDTNVSPTALPAVSNKALLTFSEQAISWTTWNAPARQGAVGTASSTGGYANDYMALYAQYLSEGPYPESQNYSDRNLSWTEWYRGPLANLQAIIDNNNAGNAAADPANGSKNNQIAVARILKAYYFWYLTDTYGDIPYFEALKGVEVAKPKYDAQQAIYNDLFKEMTEAQAQIEMAGFPVQGDILLNGDMAAWKRFANTARMFMALRLIDRDQAKAKSEFEAAMTAGAITSNAENIEYQFLGGDPNNWNPWYENYTNDNRNDYALSNTIVDNMQGDPRLAVYGESINGKIIGLPYGTNVARNIPAAYSRLSERFQGADAVAPIFTYSQVLFARAEMANRGVTSENAGDLYEQGIAASAAFYGVPNTIPHGTYAGNNAAGLEQIITQKWKHQFLNGFEAWTDWRRTGFPSFLLPGPGTLDAKGIPLRMSYPANARTVNEAGFDAAIARQGPDTNYTRVWWDVK
ncbi:SusD/RagB family nutrient-binding outer membrane lipoprotein [Nibribacter ruber]|uniref:SusD/RagB family nutrient-binding outer membrane lipoprotein n=1 Tax=Nibribacter ruber TaxID=2698458 RepID=A0A6P1P3H6_9BACT|nr:SusD/RagB family nutrient-binding outer membrane lipoprotein [Nibribacter ruber]QHL88931.1 SusD/RagB family nutrient-binding outer membrane lipoprotein [Nibribacter ruber]